MLCYSGSGRIRRGERRQTTIERELTKIEEQRGGKGFAESDRYLFSSVRQREEFVKERNKKRTEELANVSSGRSGRVFCGVVKDVLHVNKAVEEDQSRRRRKESLMKPLPPRQDTMNRDSSSQTMTPLTAALSQQQSLLRMQARK